MTEKIMDDTSVKVAVRIRPQSAKEKIDLCQICTQLTPCEPQIVLGKDKAFTFDYVFDLNSHQEEIYLNCCKDLIDGTFEGYNATIFAYGQTGSGKTYSMGTGFDLNADKDQIGIIPRAVEHLFNGIEQRKRKALATGEPAPEFKVNAQFMELYNEEILDLLDTTRDPTEKGRKSHIRIHEDANGGIYTVGVTTLPVTSLQDTIQCLKVGALSRTTASTNMNAQSSRSHAIFTLHIRQHRLAKPENLDEEDKERDSTEALTEFEVLSAKFHFVDLAGSERLKRTGATGERAKEGISINCGLLALGNVISALGDKMKKGMHVPYRDSKLTRLLQDSLGGNSRTVMIACVSPSDRDFVETLNTLKYANRARNIKNKVMVNQDKTSRQIASLRAEIQTLQTELLEYKTGKREIDADGMECVNDLYQENSMLQTEINNMRQRIKTLQETVDSLTVRNIQLLAEKDTISIAAVGDTVNEEVKKYVLGYIKDMEELRTKLIESESQVEALRRTAVRLTPSRMSLSPGTASQMSMSCMTPRNEFNASPDEHIQDILGLAKKDLRHLQKQSRSRQYSRKTDESDEEKQDNEYSDFDESPEREHPNEGVNGDEMEDEEEGEDEDLDDADDIVLSDVDSDTVSGKLHENLADLTCEISIKQKLIEELELSQKRLQTLKVHYEEKLVALENKIRETQLERDHVLSSLGDVESHSEERAKKVREEYEKKLNDMQNELKKLEAAKKEHTKLLRNQSHYEKQFKALQQDLGEMKKLKVQLMNKIREETSKNRQAEIQRNKEINQLKKEQRLKDSHIKNLEAEKRQKDIILKRKQEEVESLRRRQRPAMSIKVAGRTGKYDKEPTVPINPIGTRQTSKIRLKHGTKFNPKVSKAIWDNLEKSVSNIITKKQTIGHMEKDMERWIKQREHLSKKLERFQRKQEKLVTDNADESNLRDIRDQIDSLRSNFSYIQDNISDCQSNIMQMEECKDDDTDPAILLDTCTSLAEAKYLLEHCVSLIINKGLLAAQKDAESKELTAKLHQERMDSTFQRDMLQYLIQDKVDIEIDDSLISHRNDSDSESDFDSSEATSTGERKLKTLIPAAAGTGNVGSVLGSDSSSSVITSDLNSTASSAPASRRDKARRKTATAEELLFAGGMVPSNNELPHVLLMPVTEVSESSSDMAKPTSKQVRSSTGTRDSTVMPPPKSLPPRSARPNGPGTQIPRPENVPVKTDPSPSLPRKVYASAKPPVAPDPSAGLKRKVLSSSISSGSGSLSRLSTPSDTNAGDITPPHSPPLNRRSKDQGNVFSRLTSNTQPPSPFPIRGVINSIPNRSTQNCPMSHAYTASGHSKAVLSVYATDDFLFSSSKDRTAKIWDLQTGEEMLTLNAHPNNVVSVKYSEATSLVYTVSTYTVKIWDPRQGSICIKTLTSSGLTSEGVSTNNMTSRQVDYPLGETSITDVVLNSVGTVLYSAAGNTVRIWDLRMYKSIGKLSGGHQAAIMALAIDDTDTADGNICVVTGSKDHYIKVFDVMEDSVGVLCPKYNLEPPHYDGIQSLCLMGDLLFSGSRDTCIKKWDLAEQQLKMSINNAHKDWICGLSFMPGVNCLVSGCRSGILKVWHIESCALLGEIQAHKSTINSLCSNSNMLFSASNDKTVHFWRTPELEVLNSPDE